MFASRLLVRAPGQSLLLSAHVRAFSIARIALEPAKKAAPPPPPPPARKMTTTKKVIIEEKPAPKRRLMLSDKNRAIASKAKPKERKPTDKEKARAIKAKERERERAKREKEKEKEKAKAIKAKKAEKLYPLPPKRPLSGYFLFARDYRPKVHSGASVTETAVEIGQAWRDLPDSEKEAYARKADEAKDLYKSDLAKWVSSLNLAELTAARTNREPGTRDEAALSQLPKRPGNAYALFLKHTYTRQDLHDKVEATAQKEGGGDTEKMKKMRIGLMGKMAGELWRGMSDKEKLVYQNKAEDAKKSWEKNFGSTLAHQKEVQASATI